MARQPCFILPGQPQCVIQRRNNASQLKILQEVREATNKCWTRGDSKFKKAIAQQLD